MVAKAKKLHGSKSARTKSDKRYSKANYEFDVYDDLWQLDANKSLNFELLASLNLDPKFCSSFKYKPENSVVQQKTPQRGWCSPPLETPGSPHERQDR